MGLMLRLLLFAISFVSLVGISHMISSPKQTSGAIKMYFIEQCGHCDVLKPVWDIFKKSRPHAQMVNCGEVSCKGITAYPTIIGTTAAGVEIEFDGDRTLNELVKFEKKLM